jgi:hypothetical protein
LCTGTFGHGEQLCVKSVAFNLETGSAVGKSFRAPGTVSPPNRVASACQTISVFDRLTGTDKVEQFAGARR